MQVIHPETSLADWTRKVKESEIRRLLRYSPRYYFAGGKPGNLPVATMGTILETIGQDISVQSRIDGAISNSNILNYGPSEGSFELREVLAERLQTKEGITFTSETPANDLIITSGSQQCLYALSATILNPGDIVIAPRPTYLGFLGPLEILGVTIISVPMDHEGIIPEAVERACSLSLKLLKRIPKVLYVPTYSDNPTGVTQSFRRKKALFELAEQWNLIIIEDMAYKEIQFSDQPNIVPIKSFDTENNRVVYVGTSSKEAAVLRLSYAVVPTSIYKPLVTMKGYLDLCTSMLIQEVATRYYKNHIDVALPLIRTKYAEQARAMKVSLDIHVDGFRTDPSGGFFIWLGLDGINTTEFLQVAIPNDIIFVPGAAFYPTSGYEVSSSLELLPATVRNHEMRLCFSTLPPNDIIAGIAKMGKLLESYR